MPRVLLPVRDAPDTCGLTYKMAVEAFNHIVAVFAMLWLNAQRTILEGPMVQDHVHRLIRIPPKYAVAEVIGSIKGQSAIAVARQFGGRQRNCHGERFWGRGYTVSTVGCEEAQIRASIKHQEQLDAQGSDESGEF